MTDSNMQQITDQFSKTTVDNKGVSFQGQKLKLDTEKDCDEVVKAIQSCKDLYFLNLEGNTLGVEASKSISKALESKKELKRALWKDMFTGRMKEEIPAALQHLGNGLTLAGAQLTELDLSDNAFGPIGVKGLAGLIKSKACYQLQELKLNNNGLGIDGGKMLADALLQCHKSSMQEGKSLALRLFIGGRNRLENEGAAALAKVFQTLGTLEEIVMPQNGIYHKGIKALSESFMKNPNLKVVDLNDNTFTKEGAKHFATALPYLQKLKVLNLEDCLLRTEGAKILAQALAEGHGELEELNLSSNDIKSEGGLAVAKAMGNKHKLRQLNLNGNQFGSAGREQLKKDLERNKILCTLSDDEDGSENDEEEEDDDEEDDSEDEEDEKDDTTEENGFSPSKETKSNGQATLFNTSGMKDATSEVLSNFLKDLSIIAKPVGPLRTFAENPTLENFAGVKEEKIYEFIKSNQESSVDFYVDVFIPLLVKISSLSCVSNEQAVKTSSDVSRHLYKELFSWAQVKNQLSTVNNALFVHLGLIKSEDKNFEINWDLKGSLSALKMAISDGTVPLATQEILNCLLERDARKKEYKEITIS